MKIQTHSTCRMSPLWPGLALLLFCARALAAGEVACSFATTNLNFGIYNPLESHALESVATLTVSCQLLSQGAEKVTYSLGIQPGNSGNFASRFMSNGPERLYYNIYLDPTRTQVWGDGSGGSSNASGGFLLNQPNVAQLSQFSLYGRIPALQDVSAGSYQDTLVCVLTY